MTINKLILEKANDIIKNTKIKIEYDGKWLNLCSGKLIVFVDDEKYIFNSCLNSGGSINKINGEFSKTKGRWYIENEDFPKDFLMILKENLLEIVNEEVKYSCCGGCI